MEQRQWIEVATGAEVDGAPELVQELWSGYGRIERWSLASTTSGAEVTRSVILKVVDPASGDRAHPRGWASATGNARKLKSYRVERAFYRDHSDLLGGRARVPCRLGERETTGGGQILLEDLDDAGFGARRSAASDSEIRACIGWLAEFHATFLGVAPSGLWERGTYWHLATRPDELEALTDGRLREAAPAIDARLSGARFQTFVHGDAKIANFCFPPRAAMHGKLRVAAVDFQYVGGGVGVQDLCYFLGSCLDDVQLSSRADVYLDAYFRALALCMADDHDAAAIEAEWRALWPDAWADFTRFLMGWAPGHWKLSSYAKRMTDSVL